MKKLLIFSSLFLLTACSSSQPSAIEGRVISCSSITTNINSGDKLQCLDGSEGAVVQAITGPAVLNVWGSWCAPCKDEIPIFRSFYMKSSGKVALIGVDVEESRVEDAQKFVKENGMSWPILFDKENSTRGYFGMGVPVTWFIDKSGHVAYKHVGVITSEAQLFTLTSKHLGVEI